MSARRALLALIAVTITGQELDTAIFRRETGHSILNRAESEAERRDFRELQRTADPATRRELAGAFLAKYPQSWLLVTAWQISAAASLELKDYGRAISDARKSLRLLPENAPMLLTLAQIELTRGQPQIAKRDAADALLWLSVMAPPATIGQKDWSALRTRLEQQAVSISGERPQLPGIPRETKNEKFAGSAVCSGCHRAIYDTWQKSGMATMLRPRSEAALLADFHETREFRDDSGRVLARTGGGTRPWFEFLTKGSVWKRFPVDFAIGSKWQQAYATRTEDERIFVFPIQYSLIRKAWINYWAIIDPPHSERARVDRFPALTGATSYGRSCAVCHTSQLRLARLDDATMQRAVFREPGVNCEMCHGPSAGHAAAMKSGQPPAHVANAPPFRFARMDHRQATMICGQCHRQSAMRELGPNGEMNYSQAAPYYLWTLSRPYLEFGSRAFYKDGRFRETTFIGEAFLRSACFRRGTAHCGSCHDPHPADAAENRVSLKFRQDPDRMCLQCHAEIGSGGLARHTRHAAASSGSRCAACHMPPIMNSLLFQAASHEIEIPRADLTARFGQRDSPNACLICHADRNAQWLAVQLQAWNATVPAVRESRLVNGVDAH